MTAVNPQNSKDSFRPGKSPATQQYWAFDEAPELIQRNAELVVMVVRNTDLTYDARREKYRLHAKPLHERRISPNAYLAEDFPFRDRPSCYSLGSGFFINEHLIVTAAHVLMPSHEQLSLSDICFIKGLYHSTNLLSIHPTQIFRPVKGQKIELLPHEISMNGADWAIIDVEPEAEIKNASSFPGVRFDVDFQAKGQKIYGIGHGLGTTLKISRTDSHILTNDRNRPYFECNLPFFVSSSGSPVFNADNHKLIGMLIRSTGQLRYTKGRIHHKSGSKKLASQNKKTWQEGQECQRIISFASYIK